MSITHLALAAVFCSLKLPVRFVFRVENRSWRAFSPDFPLWVRSGALTVQGLWRFYAARLFFSADAKPKRRSLVDGGFLSFLALKRF
jgi:hypothetical protein